MKDLTIEEFETMLCSTGYLPPRTENELIFFYCETYAGKYSIFSNQGKQITQVWFETPLSYLKDNKFKVKDNGNEFYIDLNGNIIN